MSRRVENRENVRFHILELVENISTQKDNNKEANIYRQIVPAPYAYHQCLRYRKKTGIHIFFIYIRLSTRIYSKIIRFFFPIVLFCVFFLYMIE